jgi:hypothetical protein
MPETVLAKAIREAGHTLGDVAALVRRHSEGRLEPTRNQISEWQNGHVRPGPEYVSALAAVLRLDEAALRANLDAHADNRRKRRVTITASATAPVAQLRAVRDEMHRRRLMQLGGVAIGMAAERLVAPVDAEPVRLLQAAGKTALAPGVLDALEVMTDHYAKHIWHYAELDLDQRLSRQLVDVRTLLEGHATAKQKTQLCGIGARLAYLLAWVRWHRGRVDDAHLYYNASFELADQAGDSGMVAQVFAEEATVAYYGGRFDDAAELAAAGQHVAADGPVRVKLVSHEARAAARLGNAPAARAAIVATRQMVDAGDLVPTDDLFSSTPAAALHRVAGAELWLGDAHAARATGRATIEACVSDRDRALNEPHARLTIAAAEVRLGNLDVGIGEATSVLTSQPGTARGSVVAQARELLRELKPHADEPLVAEFRGLLDDFALRMLPAPSTA